MEASASLFIPFVLLSFTAGVAASYLFCLFCSNVSSVFFRPYHFGLFLVTFAICIVAVMAFEISGPVNDVMPSGELFAFSMIFLLSSVCGFFVMLPIILESIQAYRETDSF